MAPPHFCHQKKDRWKDNLHTEQRDHMFDRETD